MISDAAALSAAAASGPTPGVVLGVGLVVLVFVAWVYRLLTAHGRASRGSRLDRNDAGTSDPATGEAGPDAGPGSGPHDRPRD